MTLTPQPFAGAPPSARGDNNREQRAEGRGQKSVAHLPSSIFYLLPLVGYWLVLIHYLGAQWSVYEQYNYGWAVPFLCLYLLWRNAESRKQKVERGRREDGKAGNGKQKTKWGGAVVLWALVLCGLLYAPTRFLHEANPTWRLTSLLWTLEVIGITLLTVWLVRSPWSVVSSQACGVRSPESGVPFQLSAFSISDLVFPICFFLVAVPWPSGLENLLVQSLQRGNVTATVELLGMVGIPAIQHGSVIELSRGVVGIDEACSGIRSLQATLMLSLFLGNSTR